MRRITIGARSSVGWGAHRIRERSRCPLVIQRADFCRFQHLKFISKPAYFVLKKLDALFQLNENLKRRRCDEKDCKRLNSTHDHLSYVQIELNKSSANQLIIDLLDHRSGACSVPFPNELATRICALRLNWFALADG